MITASSATISYGDAVPGITPIYSGLGSVRPRRPRPRPVRTTATSTSPVGTYPTTCSGAVHGTSTINYVDGTITIEPARVHGDGLQRDTALRRLTRPAITATYSGLVNGDTAPATPPTCSTDGDVVEPRRLLPSTCSGAADPNYTFTYVDGSVTVDAGATS